MPAAMPGRGEHVAVVDEEHVGVELRPRGSRRAEPRRRSTQCVVAGRPSSSPAAASTKAPVQIDTIRAPRGGAAQQRRRSSSGERPVASSRTSPYDARARSTVSRRRERLEASWSGSTA